VVSLRSSLRRRPFVALLVLILLLLAGYTARAVTDHRPATPSPPVRSSPPPSTPVQSPVPGGLAPARRVGS